MKSRVNSGAFCVQMGLGGGHCRDEASRWGGLGVLGCGFPLPPAPVAWEAVSGGISWIPAPPDLGWRDPGCLPTAEMAGKQLTSAQGFGAPSEAPPFFNLRNNSHTLPFAHLKCAFPFENIHKIMQPSPLIPEHFHHPRPPPKEEAPPLLVLSFSPLLLPLPPLIRLVSVDEPVLAHFM